MHSFQYDILRIFFVDPLIGRHYDNIFIHYRPDQQWLDQTNITLYVGEAAVKEALNNEFYFDPLLKRYNRSSILTLDSEHDIALEYL